MSPRIGKFFLIWILPCLIFGSVWFYNHFLSVMTGLPCPASEGEFGDQYGALAALFSGLAFWGVIVSLLLQRDDLNMQRKELELQRQEMEDTRKEFARQTELMRLQLSKSEEQYEKRFELDRENQRRLEYYQRLERLRAVTLNIHYKELIGYAALKEIVVVMCKSMSQLMPDREAEKGFDVSELAKELMRILYAYDDILVWINVFCSTATFVCKEFGENPNLGSNYLNQLMEETPITAQGILYMHRDTEGSCKVIEELFQRNFLSERVAGIKGGTKEKRLLLKKLLVDVLPCVSDQERAILDFTNEWREKHGMIKLQMYSKK